MLSIFNKLQQPIVQLNKQSVEIFFRSKDEEISAYSLFNPSIDIDAPDEDLKEGDIFTVHANVMVSVRRGDAESPNEDDEYLAECECDLDFIFIVKEDLSDDEILNEQLFDLLIRPYVIGRIRPMLQNSPLQSLPMPIYGY